MGISMQDRKYCFLIHVSYYFWRSAAAAVAAAAAAPLQESWRVMESLLKNLPNRPRSPGRWHSLSPRQGAGQCSVGTLMGTPSSSWRTQVSSRL
jgi:hypothetical protein